MGLTNTDPDWHWGKRLAFRFVFAYFVLYGLPSFLVRPYLDPWKAVVPWVGKQVLRLDHDFTAGFHFNGDTTYHYVRLLCVLTLAAAAVGFWVLRHRKRGNDARLHEWLRVYVRFILAAEMIRYGAMKVIPSQFPRPSLDRLLQPFGDASPMGLLWTFMGASQSYTVLAGLGEMLGAALLTIRHTTLLGAFISMAVLSNVVILNFCYDVPVKLYSCHLLAMALFLIAVDAQRLADLFLFNRGADPVVFRPLFEPRWLNRGALVLRTVFVVGFACQCLLFSYTYRKTRGDLAPRSPLYGIWNVDEFVVDGEVRPPLVTDASRWRRVIFDDPGLVGIQLMSDSRQRYSVQVDPERGTLELKRRDDPNWRAAFSYYRPEPGLVTLEGQCDGRRIRTQLRRQDKPEFPLINETIAGLPGQISEQIVHGVRITW